MDPNARFTDPFNPNVDYTRGKGDGSGPNVAQVQSDAQNASASTMDTSAGGGGFDPATAATGGPGSGLFEPTSSAGTGAVDPNATEIQTSIDSTNAGVDHSRTRYSFTAETLAHPQE
ncbi:hypothetical protein BJX61DRAFT_544111 [Aspergillus egyptiacus]|nr:hypothetical protein BJX61DRAFT_544111 [Aspergillus egyptiacus]